MLPTPTAMDLGALAADEVIRAHLQTHGEMPRALVVDLWGSATLRTGGEEIAQSLAYLGCRPTWDHGTGRVTGIEVLPLASFGRARIDVTWRFSGLFRDLFPAQIALLDAAVQAVAGREELDEDNPLAAARRADASDGGLARIFGTAPGAYGAGVTELIGQDTGRAQMAAAYLDAASHSYGGALGDGEASPGAFAQRVAGADLLVHPNDDPGRDLLEGAEDVSFVGGFAAAAAALGRTPDLIMLDLTDPQRPRARPLAAALARIVRARAVSPRFIEGQMRHGARGAAELAETLDRLADFAQTTDAVPSELFDLLHEAYLADAHVRAFLLRENPAAAAAIADRLDGARRRGLWHPRRNDIDADLDALPGGGTRMNAIVNPPRRRGACPGLTAPMQTGDGLLVRLSASGATIGLDAARGSVRRGTPPRQRHHGSHRAGQHPDSRPEPGHIGAGFRRQRWAALDIDAGDGVPILTDPLATELARRRRQSTLTRSRRRVCTPAARCRRCHSPIPKLGPKVSVAIDAGTTLHLDAVPADIRLRACSGPAGWHGAALGGDAKECDADLGRGRGPASALEGTGGMTA